MICEPFDHIWVEGAKPATVGQGVVVYCALCGLVWPSGGSIYAGPIQTTLDGWQTFLAASEAPEGVFL